MEEGLADMVQSRPGGYVNLEADRSRWRQRVVNTGISIAGITLFGASTIVGIMQQDHELIPYASKAGMVTGAVVSMVYAKKAFNS